MNYSWEQSPIQPSMLQSGTFFKSIYLTCKYLHRISIMTWFMLEILQPIHSSGARSLQIWAKLVLRKLRAELVSTSNLHQVGFASNLRQVGFASNLRQVGFVSTLRQVGLHVKFAPSWSPCQICTKLVLHPIAGTKWGSTPNWLHQIVLDP